MMPPQSLSNGFALSNGFLPSLVDLSIKPNNVAPSLPLHYRAFIAVGSEEAHLRAGLLPPLKLDVQFSRIQLSPRCAFGADCVKESDRLSAQGPSPHRDTVPVAVSSP